MVQEERRVGVYDVGVLENLRRFGKPYNENTAQISATLTLLLVSDRRANMQTEKRKGR
jgi:hypothetical protein